MEELLVTVAATVLVFIPALALTARFALRPIVEAIIRLREGLTGETSSSAVEARLAQVEAQLAEMHQAIDKLAEAHHFDQELHTGQTEPALTSGSPPAPERSEPGAQVSG